MESWNHNHSIKWFGKTFRSSPTIPHTQALDAAPFAVKPTPAGQKESIPLECPAKASKPDCTEIKATRPGGAELQAGQEGFGISSLLRANPAVKQGWVKLGLTRHGHREGVPTLCSASNLGRFKATGCVSKHLTRLRWLLLTQVCAPMGTQHS